ncbi:MAG: hypothetical protein WBP41_06310 [Saprospiraceae bacterium]
MIRKIISIGIFFILFGSMLKAQSDETKFYHWSLGISAGDILHNLFNTENANRSYAAFILEYAGPHYAIQAGFRPGYNTSNTSHEGFSDSDVTDKLSFSGHLNLTRSVYADPRWDLRAGLKYDGGWSKEDIINDSGFDRVTTRRLEWNAGGGAVVDIRYRVHPRISLGTEASLIYSYYQFELQQRFTNFPDFNTTKDKITGHKINVLEPMTIYMRFHF